MNPGGHALSRRVSELRAAQQALAAEARAPKQAAPSPCWPPATTSPGPRRNGRDLPAQVAELWRCLALLDDLLGRVEQQTDDGPRGRLPRRPARGPAQRPRHRRGARRPPDGDGDAVLSPSGAWSRRAISPDDLLACSRVHSPAHQVAAEIDAVARAGPSPRPGEAEAARLAAELPGLQVLAAARRHRRSSRAHRERPAGSRRRADPDRVDPGRRGRRPPSWPAWARRQPRPPGRSPSWRDCWTRGVPPSTAAGPRSPAPRGCLPVDPDVLSRGPGLRPWLARLERLVSEGDVSRRGRAGPVAVARRADRGGGPPGGRGQRPSVAPTPRAAGAAGRPGSRPGGGSPRTRWCPSWRRRHGHWPSL